MRMHGLFWIILLLMVIAQGPLPGLEPAPKATAEEIAVSREIVDSRSEEFLQKMVREEHLTGVALVMREGEIVHAKGYGPATKDRPNDVKTVFHVASITKQFTAAAIMQLVEQRKVDLRVSVNEYLPSKYISPKWHGVHLEHLLSHTSGIPDYAVVRDYYNVVDGFCLGETVDGMVKEAMRKDLSFSPGSQFEYSNIGYTLLGLVIENVSSTRFDQYMKANILDPMGMKDSRIHVIGHVPVAAEANGYRWDAEKGVHVRDDIVSLPVTAPDGCLVTTLSDLTKWMSIYMDREQEVLSKESLLRMTTPVISIGKDASKNKDARSLANSYGYGLFLGNRLISHPGYIVGFRSHFFLQQDKRLLVVVFTNNTTNNPRRIAVGLLSILEETRN